MRNIAEPGQNPLFDYHRTFLSDVAYKRLTTSFHAVFRDTILSLMPAKEIGEHFHKVMGRPTKELYSMAGLLLLKEFHNWTTSDAVDAYLFDYRVQYALNLGRDNISFCERTLERYMKLLREEDLAAKIFDDVTEALIKELDIQVDQQRLDSTHVFSDMATFSRTKLMGVAIKRFLVQLKRRQKFAYLALPEEIRSRYEKNEHALFADVSKDKAKRSTLRQDVAEQMYDLIQRFSGNEGVESMNTFKQMVTIFNQQCELTDRVGVVASDDGDDTDDVPPEPEADAASEVSVRKKTGGNVIQNPSDPDATYDGHKGPGYQVQICETSNPENDVQLLTSVLPQTAAEADGNAVGLILDDLEKNDRLPDQLLADTLYGGDDNVLTASEKDVDLVSPVSGCPPKSPAEKPTPKQQRLQQRREDQQTDEWREIYNSRAQIEGTIGSVKRRTGMVRLRYRGEKSMFSSMCLKLAGWNISRACAALIRRKSARIAQETAEIAEIFLSTGAIFLKIEHKEWPVAA
jgi:hypothetical protein